MRSFRNSLRSPLHAMALGALLAPCFLGPLRADAPPPTPAPDGKAPPFFPVAVGNAWSYRCSVEGEHALDKTVTIMAAEPIAGRTFFRSELIVDDRGPPLTSFLLVDDSGSILSTDSVDSDSTTLIITPRPQIGERIGDYRVAAFEKVKAPAVGLVEAVRLENFSLDDPELDAEQRMLWEARFFAPGIGLVAEADGLGGECALVRLHLIGP